MNARTWATSADVQVMNVVGGGAARRPQEYLLVLEPFEPFQPQPQRDVNGRPLSVVQLRRHAAVERW